MDKLRTKIFKTQKTLNGRKVRTLHTISFYMIDYQILKIKLLILEAREYMDKPWTRAFFTKGLIIFKEQRLGWKLHCK